MSSYARKPTYTIAEEDEEEVTDIEEINTSSGSELVKANEEVPMSIDTILEAMEDVAMYGKSQDADKGNADIIIVQANDNFTEWFLMSKFINLFRIICTPERRYAFAKNMEKLMFFLLTATLAIGTVVFISFIGYKIYSCNNNTKALLNRISAIQGEKVKLLKIINDFAEQNATFYELIRNDTEYMS